MSTRSSLAINMPDFPLDNPNIKNVPPERRDPDCPAFHLYQEAFEQQAAVYLELSGATIEFEATNGQVMVRIPKEVWNRIVKIGPLP